MYGYPNLPKSRLRSKTYWANLVALTLTGVEMQMGVLQPFLTMNAYALIAFLLPIMNLVLRELTDAELIPMRPAYRRSSAPLPPDRAGRHRPEEWEE